LGQPDEVQFAHTRAVGRVIVTDDTDLLALAANVPDHPGVLYCRRAEHSIGEIVRFLVLLHGVYEPADMVGRVEYL
jgi:predicted nuclease of predicted toxin-antitoxin system